uniref:Uncharacterized protein n=1 Tax=Anopheles minimus TaxID=112268 RepID=A0A182WPZ9_9DIPT
MQKKTGKCFEKQHIQHTQIFVHHTVNEKGNNWKQVSVNVCAKNVSNSVKCTRRNGKQHY